MKKVQKSTNEKAARLQQLAASELQRVEGGACNTAGSCYPNDENETGT